MVVLNLLGRDIMVILKKSVVFTTFIFLWLSLSACEQAEEAKNMATQSMDGAKQAVGLGEAKSGEEGGEEESEEDDD